MFNLGDKVYIKRPEMAGYLVEKRIDPIEEYEVKYNKQDYFTYCKVRVYRTFYKDGYFDFQCMENELHKAE